MFDLTTLIGRSLDFIVCSVKAKVSSIIIYVFYELKISLQKLI